MTDGKHIAAGNRARASKWLLVAASLGSVFAAQVRIDQAAARYVPGVTWSLKSVVKGDFSCSGRVGQAILGTTSKEIVVAIFLHGTSEAPEVIRDSVRDIRSAQLKVEGLDFDPKEDLGYVLEGFKRSRRCKGLNLSDGQIDSLHLYWDTVHRRFEGWSR